MNVADAKNKIQGIVKQLWAKAGEGIMAILSMSKSADA